MLPQDLLDPIPQNARLADRHIARQIDMRLEMDIPPRHRPHMRMMDVFYAVDRLEPLLDILQLYTPGNVLHQDMDAFVDYRVPFPQDIHADQYRQDRIDPQRPGQADRHRPADHGDRGKEIREQMRVRRAHVQILVRMRPQKTDRYDVREQADGSDREHQGAVDRLGINETLDGRLEQEHGNDDQRARVEQRREDLRPFITERAGLGTPAAAKAHGDISDHQGRGIA